VVVLGLPLWAMVSPEQRLATLGHELGHLRGADGLQCRLEFTAEQILLRGLFILTPLDRDELGDDFAFLSWILTGLSRIVAAPFSVLLWASGRLSAKHGQHREFLADRRSAEVVGSEAMISALCEDLSGTHTVAKSAVARGENPFEVLAARSAKGLDGLAPAAVQQAGWSHRADASHPPDALRMENY
jgi:heat shock protein HtpX